MQEIIPFRAKQDTSAWHRFPVRPVRTYFQIMTGVLYIIPYICDMSQNVTIKNVKNEEKKLKKRRLVHPIAQLSGMSFSPQNTNFRLEKLATSWQILD